MNKNDKPTDKLLFMGNVSGFNRGGYGMDVFHEAGICRCLNASPGGGGSNLRYD